MISNTTTTAIGIPRPDIPKPERVGVRVLRKAQPGLDVISATNHWCKGPGRYSHQTYQHGADAAVNKSGCTVRSHLFYYCDLLVKKKALERAVERAQVLSSQYLHHNNGFEPHVLFAAKQ
jgi:hypothetical protein